MQEKQIKTFYEILEVSPAAGYQDIRKAYRNLAKIFHPDKIPNATTSDHERFSRIAEAYAILSNLNKRRQYDLLLKQQTRPGAQTYSFWQPHYSGYPYFRYDIFTPFFHSFFMGGPSYERKKDDLYRSAFLNVRVLLVAILGAFIFFKLFSTFNGTVTGKSIEPGLFNNVSYYLLIKTESGDNKKRRVRPGFYDIVKESDRVKKELFSLNYKLNGEKINAVTTRRFLLQAGLIYILLSGGLFFLEYSRK